MSKKSRKKEAIKRIGEHLWEISDKKDHGLCPPGIDYDVAINELVEFFLGEDWYIVFPLPGKQANFERLYAIESKHWDKRSK